MRTRTYRASVPFQFIICQFDYNSNLEHFVHQTAANFKQTFFKAASLPYAHMHTTTTTHMRFNSECILGGGKWLVI